ncbi:MAG: class I SAM-dependent methyltransferase [Chloroflexi bacterium]|nr:class I SAM-dependent methyltransferase [Chloroflexota bacterium]
MTASFRPGEYLLAMEGLAILRAWGTDPAAARARAEEIVAIVRGLEDGSYGDSAVIPEYGVANGYALWASTYDVRPNVLIDVEEPVVHALLSSRPAGRALDAACGTGRYARWLAERGHEVVGIDASEEMLALARDKVPGARFLRGELDALDLRDASMDLVVCALALTHLPALDRAIAELGRVLAPGGRLILSDVHPLCAALGLHAFFRSADGGRGCIRNRYHPLSAYLSAFKAAHLAVVRCVELPWDERSIEGLPTYPFIPEALAGALRGLPFVLIWELANTRQALERRPELL